MFLDIAIESRMPPVLILFLILCIQCHLSSAEFCIHVAASAYFLNSKSTFWIKTSCHESWKLLKNTKRGSNKKIVEEKRTCDNYKHLFKPKIGESSKVFINVLEGSIRGPLSELLIWRYRCQWSWSWVERYLKCFTQDDWTALSCFRNRGAH